MRKREAEASCQLSLLLNVGLSFHITFASSLAHRFVQASHGPKMSKLRRPILGVRYLSVVSGFIQQPSYEPKSSESTSSDEESQGVQSIMFQATIAVQPRSATAYYPLLHILGLPRLVKLSELGR
jgi:hypothetical protein